MKLRVADTRFAEKSSLVTASRTFSSVKFRFAAQATSSMSFGHTALARTSHHGLGMVGSGVADMRPSSLLSNLMWDTTLARAAANQNDGNSSKQNFPIESH